MLRNRLMYVLGLLVVASMILSACGGATATQPPAAPAATEPPAPVATEPPAPAAPEMADTIIVGAWQEPQSFYDVTSSQAIQVEVEMVFRPRLITRLNYELQANPALVEGDVPTLENGGAVLNDVTVAAGDPIFDSATYAVGAATADTQAKQLVVTLKFKEGLKWDDGEPLTAHDWAFAYTTNCSEGSEAIDITYCPLGSVDGAGGILTSMEATDDTTLVATYVPGAIETYFALTPGLYGVLAEHVFQGMAAADIAADERATGSENVAPLGYGPYKLVEWKKGDHITFAPNENWAGEAPKTPNLIYKFYSDSTALAAGVIAGEIDSTSGITGLSVSQAPYMKSVAARGLVNYTTDQNAASFEMLQINYDDPTDTTFKTPHPVLSEFCVRKAIAMSVDRQKMVDTIYYGESAVVNQPQLPQMASYDESAGVVTFDPEAAKQTLEECGWVDSDGDGFREKNGVKAAFNYITTSGNALRQQASQIFQANMKDLGIEVTLNYQPSSVVFSSDVLYGRNFNVIQFANVFSPPDGASWWFGIANCGQVLTPENNFAGGNYTGWCYKPASDAAADAGYLTLDEAQRKADWSTAIAAYFSENDAATDYHSGGYNIIALYTRPDYLATNPGLSGAALDPTDYFTWNVETWTLTPAE